MPLRSAKPAPEAYSYPLLIKHLLGWGETSTNGQEIVYRDQARFSYGQFRERIGRLASALRDLGAEQGMTVAVMDWDSHRYLEAYFAIPMFGAVLQTVNVRMSPAQIAYTLAHADAEILIVHSDFMPLLEPLLAGLPRVRAIIGITDGQEAILPNFCAGEYEALLAEAWPSFAFEDFDENAIATTFYTTGTTGDPKGVCFSHRQLVLHTIAACGPFGSTGSEGLGIGSVYMPMTPMFHVHAWGSPYVATMLGLKQVYPGRYDPGMLIDLHEREGVNYSHCVPTLVEMLLAAAAARGKRLDGWHITVGGSSLSAKLRDAAKARGLMLVAGYGMSETGPVLTLSRPDRMAKYDDEDQAHRLIAAGQPTPLVAVRIVDEAMQDLPHDGVSEGELIVRAPWLTQCYTGNEAASEQLWRGGWLHTQDIATIDEYGNVRIRDRLKDVIKSGGEWICSITVEEIVAIHPAVAQVAVIGIPNERWGERPMAFVVPHATAEAESDEILAAMNSLLAAAADSGRITKYALLERVELVESLPLTSVGKIDKKVLRGRAH